jgi:hypothetical protein
MWRNFLLDEDGDKLNTILAATGFNLRKMLRRLEAGAMKIIFNIQEFIWQTTKIAAGIKCMTIVK